MLFCVPSMALKKTLAWLRTMFTRTGRGTVKTETLPPPFPRVLEYSSTFEALSRCRICSLKIPALDKWDAIEPVLYAAEKCDMPSLDRVDALRLAHTDVALADLKDGPGASKKR